MRRLVRLGLAGLLGALTGCGPSAPPPPGVLGPLYPTDLTPDTWNEIKPGGDTICARGSPYSFFVYPGKVNKVVVDFIGGGACWTPESCSFAGSLFSDSVDDLKRQVKNGVPGMYDKTKLASPVQDWFHVAVTYCTGDIHWGNNVQTYGTGADAVTIHHKGAVNSRAVLDWVYDKFPAPDTVLVQGCSAGSYGSIYWAPDVKHHYPHAKVFQFGDSGAGVVTPTFFHDSFPQWHATDYAPKYIESLNPDTTNWEALQLPDLYARVGAAYPDLQLTQFNTMLDATQTFFFQAMGGTDATEWSAQIQASIATIQKTTPNFNSFTAPGNYHCVLDKADFAQKESNGTRFVDWYTDFVAGKGAVNVAPPADPAP
jgi:hypothetical protein